MPNMFSNSNNVAMQFWGFGGVPFLGAGVLVINWLVPMESKQGTDVHLFSSEFLQRETIDGQVIGVVEEGNTLI